MPRLVPLSPELAAKLGFLVAIQHEDEAIRAELIGPTAAPNGCKPSGSGAALLAADATELMAFVARLDEDQEAPSAIGYFTDTSHKMTMWIDYAFPALGGEDIYGRRYVIDSLSEYMRIGIGMISPIS